MAYLGKKPSDIFRGLTQKDTFTGDGSTVTFDLSKEAPNGGANDIQVFVSDVRQEPTVDYTLGEDGSGDIKRVTFTSAPSNSAPIFILNPGRESALNTIGDQVVTAAKLNDNVISGNTALTTGLASTDEFLISDAGTPKKMDVSVLTGYYDSLTTTLTNKTINRANNTITINEADIADLGAYITASSTDTLTNKTLTTPVISTISNTGTLTLPTSTDTLVGRATTDTLTNKTINSASNTITITESNISDLGSYITASSTNTLTNKTINSASNTITITESNISDLGSYITASSTDTLTNKTLSAPVFSGDVGSNISVAGNVIPDGDDTRDLGTSSLAWANVYTKDLHLNNTTKEVGNEVDGTKGSWVIQEGSSDLYIINRLSGKKYKFKLEEIV